MYPGDKKIERKTTSYFRGEDWLFFSWDYFMERKTEWEKRTEKGILTKSDVYFMTPSNLAKRLFFYTICAGHFFYEDSYYLEREDYHSFLFLDILKGRAKIHSNGKEIIATAGDLILLDCHIPHGYAAMEELETVWLHFDGESAGKYV